VALDEALVPSAQRLRIGRINFRLPSDIQSKESTLQVVYDVLRRSPFFRAFLVTAYVPKIYMQEFWATATVHQHSIRFIMDTRKHIVDLEAFREMLHISPRVPGQSFAELPFEEEILEFLRSANRSAEQEEESFDPIPRTPEDGEDDGNGLESIFTTGSSTVTPIPSPKSTMTLPIMTTTTTASQPPITPTTIPSIDLQNLPTFASEMPEAVREAVQIQTVRLQDSLQRENDEFLRTIDDNMKKIIKEQVKNQVKAQVTRILPMIEESMNAQLEAEVLTRSSHSSRTSYHVAADLSEMKLKKILIDKMEGNKRIIAFTDLKIVEWHNYKHLDWISVRLDDDKIYKFKEGDFKRLRLQDIEDMLLLLVQGKLSNLTVEDRFAFNKRLNLTKPDMYRSDLKRREAYTAFSNPRGFIYQNRDKKNRLMRIDELHKFSDGMLNDVRNALDDRLKGIRMQYLPTTIWRKGDKDRAVAMIQAIDKMLKTRRIVRSLERFVGGRQYEGDFRMLQRTIRFIFYGFAVNREFALDVYSKRRIIAVTDLKIVEWHNYKHLDWISVRRDDDKIYKFKEGNFKRLRLQDIEDMLLLLVQGKLSNLTVEERFAFNKRLNLTKPDMYRSDLKRREAYTAFSNPRGFIYQNRDKKNRLMPIDELHKFSDGMLNDVRNALDDRLKGIRMQYLPTTIWRKGDKDRAAAMIQAIDKMLKTKRIMRSLERFVGGRQYEGDFRMLQRTIRFIVCCSYL
nr:hypothetical protein [Tanacetum cinerariifolium]